jgi:hypothetical protein
MTFRGAKSKTARSSSTTPVPLPEGAEVLIHAVEDDQSSIWQKLAKTPLKPFPNRSATDH